MRTVPINKHLKLRIMRGRAVEGLTVRDSDTSPFTFKGMYVLGVNSTLTKHSHYFV